MNRCGIPRKDGTVRIGVLCDACAGQALKILMEQGRPFYIKEYGDNSAICEGCREIEYRELEGGTNAEA